jgi:multiple antibiotic resistance protein
MADLQLYAKAFVTLLVLVNPLEGIPIYLSATQHADPALRAAIARRTPIAVTFILLAALFLGNALLRLFGISIGAFQVGGGALLCWVAFQMTFGSAGSGLGAPPGGRIDASFAVVPLGIPLLAGPGAISGAILYGTRAHDALAMGILGVVFVAVGFATYLSLVAAGPLVRILKDTGIDIATRIMGIVIAAIAVEMMAHGVASLFHLEPPR